MKFSEQLKALRTSAGLTQQQMAELTGIPLRSIANWEGGKRIPPEYLQRYVLTDLKRLQVKSKSED